MLVKSSRLPKGFVLAKPIAQEGYDESVIYELERQGRLIITRKRDGWKMLALIDSKRKVHIYTDGINEVDSRLDHIKEELGKAGFKANTLVVGEAVADVNDNDDLGKVISVFHSNIDKALAIQKKLGKIRLMIFGVVYLGSESKEVSEALSQAYQMCFRANAIFFDRKFKYIFPVPVLSCTFDEAKKLVLKKGWEGLVLYDKDYVLTYRTDGKSPKRPEGCYKWKPIWEDDFVVRLRLMRPNTDVLKELVLRQIDPTTGKEFICGKLGSFTNQMRQDLTKLELPFVVQAAFEARYPKSGKIRNARFMRVHDDKPVEQCIAPKSYPEADYPIAYVMGYCNTCEMTVDFYQDGGGWECERCGHWVDEVTDVRED